MKATIYTSQSCLYCVKAKNILNAKAISYEEKIITTKTDLNELVQRLTPYLDEGQTILVPQIWLDDNYIGGYDRLVAHLNSHLENLM